MAEVAPSALSVPSSRIREIAELAMRLDAETVRPEDRILRLYFGESNIPTPDYIKRAAQKAMADGYTFYTENAGLPSLRRMLARHYESMHRIQLDPTSEIVVTASGMQALNTGIRCTLDPGDEAIVLTPAWGNQSASVRMANATPREVPLRLIGARYQVDFDALESAVSPRTRLLVYTSPSNPLGWVATLDEQRRLLEFARRHNLWLLADEVYERLWYAGEKPGEPAPSILRLATREDALFVVGSFSKSYCMTGWRVGWIVARKDLAAKATQFNEFVISHAPSFAQRAAETALEWGEDTLRKMLAEYRGNRDFALAALRRIPGFTVPDAEGAFYLFPRVDGLSDSLEFCRRFLLESRVGLAPGVAFGAGGEGCLRVCYAVERPLLEAALSRLRDFATAGKP
jgi:hypothetical protein